MVLRGGGWDRAVANEMKCAESVIEKLIRFNSMELMVLAA